MASRANLFAAALIAPLLILVVASFIVPLLVTLYTAIGNPEVRATLPRTTAAVRAWNGEGLPPEAAYAAIAAELAQAQEGQSIGQLSRRLNFEQLGMRALLFAGAAATLVAALSTGEERTLAQRAVSAGAFSAWSRA